MSPRKHPWYALSIAPGSPGRTILMLLAGYGAADLLRRLWNALVLALS